MKNMNDGITSFKFNKGPRAYKLKRDKVPVIPFLSLSSGGRTSRREGQKGRLGELRVAEDTKRTPRGPSESWTVTAAPEAGLDEAAGRQHAVEGTVPPYSELAALPPALFLFRSLPTPAAQETTPRSRRSPPHGLWGRRCHTEPRPTPSRTRHPDDRYPCLRCHAPPR